MIYLKRPKYGTKDTKACRDCVIIHVGPVVDFVEKRFDVPCSIKVQVELVIRSSVCCSDRCYQSSRCSQN